MKIEKLLIKNSGWTWDRLREARKLGYQIGEESVTDFVILNLKKYGAGKLQVNSFTRHEEAINGADWEWWLTGPSGSWIGMRIQAKIINLQSEKFEHLHHTNKHGTQLDQLIKDASRNCLVPLYCMYSNWDPQKYKTPKNCPADKNSVRHYGNSIVGIDVVKNLHKRKKKDLASIIRYLIPMHCIFCCKDYRTKGDLPVRAFEFMKSEGFTRMYENQNVSLEKILLKKRVPGYVRYLSKTKSPNLENYINENVVEEHELNFADDLRLKRVTIIKELIQDKEKTFKYTNGK